MGSSINLRCTERMPREAELDSEDVQRRLGREFSTADTQNSEELLLAGLPPSLGLIVSTTSDYLV